MYMMAVQEHHVARHLLACVTVSDVWRGPRRAARSDHDVAGPGLDNGLPEAELHRMARS